MHGDFCGKDCRILPTFVIDLQSADFFCLSDLRSAYQTAFGLYLLFYYKESTLFFDFSFWLHQGRIPRHTCRFYCCLAAHQRTRKKDSAEPSFPILWTPPHPPGGYPLRRGITAAAGLQGFSQLVSGAVVTPQFRMLCSYLCSGYGRSRFSWVVGLVSHVFHYWGDRSFVPAATVGFAMVFRRICADRG